MYFSFYTLVVLFILIAVILMLLILIQKGRGGGLASAFGGGGGNTAFGSKTGDVLTWATSIVFGVFLLLAVGLNLLANGIHEDRVGVGATTQPAETNDPLPLNPAAAGEPGVENQDAEPAPAPPITPTAVEAAPSTPASTQP